jgi:hypothetical protein
MNEIELIRKYEPVLRFAQRENFYPMRAEEYVPYCSLHVEGKDGPIVFPPFVRLPHLAELFPEERFYMVYANQWVTDPELEKRLRSLVEKQEVSRADFSKFIRELQNWVKEIGIDLAKLFLPLKEETKVVKRAIDQYGGLAHHPPTYYYRVAQDGGYTVIQYWFFYAYNDFGTSHHGANDHEADWESLHLFFESPNESPICAAYSAHLGRELCAWGTAEMEREGDHPVAYIGAGSHASYPTLEMASIEKFVAGDVVLGGTEGTPWGEPEPLDKPWFTDFKGRWGSYEWSNPNPVVKVLGKVGGAPAGPKFDRDGTLRPKWEKPAHWASLK